MSTIDIAAFSAPSTPASPTRLRLTVRGRRVLALLAALPAVIALTIAIVSGGGALASGESSAPAGTFTEVTVLPGDTLWSLAESVAPAADPRDVIDAIIRLNVLASGQLEAGQTISIPLEYTAAP